MIAWEHLPVPIVEKRTKVRSNECADAEKCGERCAAVGALLLRSNGKVGEDGRTAVDKMAWRCAAVGALVRRSVGEGTLKPRQRCADAAGVGGRGRAICS